MRKLLPLFVCAALVAAVPLWGCGTSSSSSDSAAHPPAGGAQPNEPPAPSADYSDSGSSVASCTDFATWRESQDALESAGSSEELDPDGDGVACADELGQSEYETGWDTAYDEACAWVFSQSSTGFLYDDSGTEYSTSDCSNANSGADTWNADATTEPEESGLTEGWASACDETFGTLAGYGDLYLNDEGIDLTQADCDLASSY